MRQTLDAARAFALHRVELTVRQDNTNAIALYRKLGFAIEGVMRDGIKVDGVCENVVLMGLLLELPTATCHTPRSAHSG